MTHINNSSKFPPHCFTTSFLRTVSIVIHCKICSQEIGPTNGQKVMYVNIFYTTISWYITIIKGMKLTMARFLKCFTLIEKKECCDTEYIHIISRIMGKIH